MGESKRKRLRAMTEGPISIDKLNEELREQRILIACARFRNFVSYIMSTPENAVALFGEVYAQTSIDAATVSAIGELVAEKLGISPEKIVDRAMELAEGKLDAIELENKIIIMVDGIKRMAADEKESGGQASSGAGSQKKPGDGTPSPHN